MVAILLYIIGLVTALISIALVGYGAPALYQDVSSAVDAGNSDMFGVVSRIAANLAWSVGPIVGGLVLMGFGRVIMLLAAIDKSLRRTH